MKGTGIIPFFFIMIEITLEDISIFVVKFQTGFIKQYPGTIFIFKIPNLSPNQQVKLSSMFFLN